MALSDLSEDPGVVDFLRSSEKIIKIFTVLMNMNQHSTVYRTEMFQIKKYLINF